MSLTYMECKSQYNSLRKTYQCIKAQEGKIKDFYSGIKPAALIFTGCGSGFYLAQSFEMIARVKLGVCSASIPAGDLMLHYERYEKMLEGSMLVVASRSGSTSEIINSIRQLKDKMNIPVLGIACMEDSPLSEISDYTICLPWAYDESVCQTRTVSSLYAAMVQIIAAVSGDEALPGGLEKVMNAGDGYIARYEKELQRLAGMDWDNAVVLADGEIQGIAAEGALAFQEIARTPSNYYHLLDSRHGPMVMIRKNTLVIACLTTEELGRQRDLIGDVVKNSAKVVVYTDTEIEPIEGVELHVTSGFKMEHVLRGIPFIFVSQMLSYYKAVKSGVNPDQPDGLSPWIKL